MQGFEFNDVAQTVQCPVCLDYKVEDTCDKFTFSFEPQFDANVSACISNMPHYRCMECNHIFFDVEELGKIIPLAIKSIVDEDKFYGQAVRLVVRLSGMTERVASLRFSMSEVELRRVEHKPVYININYFDEADVESSLSLLAKKLGVLTT